MLCEISKNNPLIGNKKEKLAQLEQVISKINQAQKILEETVDPLNKILEG
jgi:exonuclease VII small subunit